jgi:serine/threonine protein kinase
MNAPTSLHPSDQTLTSYGLGKLDDILAEAVNKHLARCPDCRKRVAEMSADSFLERVRDAQKPLGTSSFGPSQLGGSQSYMGPNTAAPPPANTLPPGLADHPDYEIKRELGRGGMGVVYLAHNTLMGRDEVLKVMARQIIERPGVLERFLREIRVVAKLRHPNIVTAYHATRLGDSIVFAMEYVEGLDLSRIVTAKGPLPVGHACNFVCQAALGLQHAHEEGLVHRDIKPGNLMLSRNRDKATVKVLDFGLAKATREEKVDAKLTSVGQALGTPDYIAPEQIIDAPSADIRADIYSLGGTFYHLLTGRPPFQADSLYDMFQAHMSRDADPVNFVRPEVPAELAALVAKMMAKDPARRFQMPGEVAQALTPFFKKGNVAFKGTNPQVSRDGQPAPSRPETEAVPVPAERPTDAARPVLRAKKSTATAAPGPQWESLIELRATKSSADESPKVEPTRRPPWKKWPIALAGALFGLIALGVIIITIRDKNGRETKITVPDDSTVVVEGPRKNVELKPPANRQAATGNTSDLTSELRDAGGPPVDKPQGPPTDNVGASEFVSLFNGKDLSGWKKNPFGQVDWVVRDRAIQTTSNGRLYTNRGDYRDFHLRAELKAEDNCLGGVFFRSAISDHRESSYIAIINTLQSHSEEPKTGSLSRDVHTGSRTILQSAGAELVRPQQWFTLEVIAVGSHFIVKIDGKQVAEGDDLENTYDRGYIALQRDMSSHGGELSCRKIEIKELTGKADGAKKVDVYKVHAGEDRISENEVVLFNGRNLEGWAAFKNRQPFPVSSDGFVDRGELHCPRDVVGSLRTISSFQNFVLKLEFRIPRGAGDVRSQIWLLPKDETATFQINGVQDSCIIICRVAPGEAGDLAIGGPGRDDTIRSRQVESEKAIGEWNEMEIRSIGSDLTYFLNGRIVNEAKVTGAQDFHICVVGRIGSDVRYRNIRLRTLARVYSK